MLCRPKYPVITLTTDFGIQDHYVASMKGILLGVNPAMPIVDITHEIPPFSIISGAYAISQAAPCFPPNTVHIIVVDPGVGTARRPVLLQSGGQIFIAPDNGVLTMVADTDRDSIWFEITRRELMRRVISATFHGRDVFAPVGAAIASGKVGASDVGPQIFDIETLESLSVKLLDEENWAGRILSVDRFGNLITNFRSSTFSFVGSEPFEITIAGQIVTKQASTFGEVAPGEIFAYFGSSGYVEIGINQGNAALRLQAAAGEPVTLSRSAPPLPPVKSFNEVTQPVSVGLGKNVTQGRGKHL
ncbi:MAG: S-adenosyl-l-methionine hydroxide adenosyltransferase family protein [Bryobacteraceae bacterium]